MRPCTIGAYPRYRSLGAYAVDTTDFFGDASDLNAAPPPPPAPVHTGPSPALLLALAAGAFFLLKGKL
jgi:hypothetical protein